MRDIKNGVIKGAPSARANIGAFVLILGCLIACGLANIASAADIPSNASGDYIGDGWNCRVLAYELSPGAYPSRALDLTCTDGNNETRVGVAVAYGCPQAAPGTSVPLAPIRPGVPAVVANVAAYQTNQLTLIVAGVPYLLDRAQEVASPRPYAGCGTSTNVPPWPPLPSPFAGLCPAWDPYCGAL